MRMSVYYNHNLKINELQKPTRRFDFQFPIYQHYFEWSDE